MQTTQRIKPLDDFRGLALWMMVIGNYLADVKWVPDWLKHKPDVGLTIADIVAPFFILAIGISYQLSFQKRIKAEGKRKGYLHFVRRYIILILIGFVLSSGEIWVGVNENGINWGVLQSIGVAGLLTLLVVEANYKIKLLIGSLLLGVYQYLLDKYWLDFVLKSPHGGIYGSLSWAAMLILATGLAEFYLNNKHNLFYFSIGILTLIGLILSTVIPISKNRVSATYTLLSLGLSGIVFSIFHLINKSTDLKLEWLNRWGKNPLLIFLLHDFTLALFVLPPYPKWHQEAPPLLVGIQLIFMVFVIDFVAQYLQKRNKILSL